MPSNPFLYSSEPDWIAASEAPRPKIQAQLESSSTVLHKVPSKGSYKVPPPFNPDYRLPSNFSHVNRGVSGKGYVSEERTPSATSFVSPPARQARKPAPSVPKKPASLTSQGTSDMTLELKSSTEVTGLNQPLEAGSIRSRTSIKDEVNVPHLPHRTAQTLTQSTSNLSSSNSSFPESTRPSPNRTGVNNRAPAPITPSRDVVNGTDLLGENDDSAQNIPSLQPLRTDRDVPTQRG